MTHRGNNGVIILLLVVFPAVFNSCGKGPKEDEVLTEAIDAQRTDRFDDAIESFQLFIKTFPKSSKVPEALYALGIVYQKKKDFQNAVKTFKRVVDDYPDHPTASGAAYLRAMLLNQELKDTTAAQTAYEDFLKRYPNAPMAGSARIELANLLKPVSKKK
jgi:tol-pal system protein YbgF